MMLPGGDCEFGLELWAARRAPGSATDGVTALTGWLHEHGFPRVQAGDGGEGRRAARARKCGLRAR
jgi:hypothetical protein